MDNKSPPEAVDIENRNSNEEYEWSEVDEQSEHNRLLDDFRRNDLEGVVKVKRKATGVDLQKYDLSKQPIFHQRNKGFLEKLCSCCTERCDLNRKEVRLFCVFNDCLRSNITINS